jgi:ribonuclease HI
MGVCILHSEVGRRIQAIGYGFIVRDDRVEIYADGSCRGNPSSGYGGWGAIVRWHWYEEGFSGGEDDTTSQRMELTAVIEGLRALKIWLGVRPILVVTDSKYVIKLMTGEWRGVANVDLIRELYRVMEGKRIEVEHVRGHSGHELNERAHELAYGESTKRMGK